MKYIELDSMNQTKCMINLNSIAYVEEIGGICAIHFVGGSVANFDSSLQDFLYSVLDALNES